MVAYINQIHMFSWKFKEICGQKSASQGKQRQTFDKFSDGTISEGNQLQIGSSN